MLTVCRLNQKCLSICQLHYFSTLRDPARGDGDYRERGEPRCRGGRRYRRHRAPALEEVTLVVMG